jgi:2-polyprenyl-3-methyl-5-hydroxy-6-metoxy-1,4-benzoquinol methylase
MSDGYDPGFDLRWKKHPRPQVTTEKFFWAKTGWKPDMFKGQTVLDAGCGCGRYSAIAARCGAIVTGVDASPCAIKAAAENVPIGKFQQANLLKLDDLEDESFDMAFSLGVLHHTESTERAFFQVARKVRKGGHLAVWVYAQPVEQRLLVAEKMLHEITRAVSPEILHDIFERYAPRVRDAYGIEWGPLQQILRVSLSQDNDECISDTFDWHTPQYRWWHTNTEVCRWFNGAGFDNLHILDFPVSVNGTKIVPSQSDAA